MAGSKSDDAYRPLKFGLALHTILMILRSGRRVGNWRIINVTKAIGVTLSKDRDDTRNKSKDAVRMFGNITMSADMNEKEQYVSIATFVVYEQQISS
jgi:hypothetical protein